MNKLQIDAILKDLPQDMQNKMENVIKIIVKAKKDQQKICVIINSENQILNGITTFMAELIKKGIIDGGILTSSSIINHEIAGAVKKIKYIDGKTINFGSKIVILPHSGLFQYVQLNSSEMEEIQNEISIDSSLITQLTKINGDIKIGLAGGLAFPLGLRAEMLAAEILKLNQKLLQSKYTFEYLAGLGARLSKPIKVIWGPDSPKS